METTDPKEFARLVLWQLASIQAGLSEVKAMVAAQSAAQCGTTPADLLARSERQFQALRRKLYADFATHLGLAPDPPGKRPGPE